MSFFYQSNSTVVGAAPGRFRVAGYALGPRDAVVFLACTPSGLRYFSNVNYVLARHDAGAPSDAPARMPFASIADATNHEVVNTTGGLDGAAPFAHTALFVSTASASTHAAVAAAFAGAGLDARAVNLDVVPADWAQLKGDPADMNGTTPPDYLVGLFRASLFENATAEAVYKNARFPALLVRADADAPPVPADDALLAPAARGRGTGAPEPDSLRAARDGLAQRVAQSLAVSDGATTQWRRGAEASVAAMGLTNGTWLGNLTLAATVAFEATVPDRKRCIDDRAYEAFVPPIPSVGYNGSAGCLGDVTDALYSFVRWNTTDWTAMRFGPAVADIGPPSIADDAAVPLDLDDDAAGGTELFAVVGVDHARTGKATYTNVDLNVITPSYVQGLVALSDAQLAGSAEVFGGCGDAWDDELDGACPLWVALFARSCPPAGDPRAPYCVRVPAWERADDDAAARDDDGGVAPRDDTDDFVPRAEADVAGAKWASGGELGDAADAPLAPGAMLSFVNRAYLEPGQHVCPSPNELVPPVMLRFERAYTPMSSPEAHRAASSRRMLRGTFA